MIKLSVKKPYTVFVTVILIIVLGIVAYVRMVPDLFPKMDFPYVVVLTSYPGSTPEKVETEINKPLERSFVMLENVENVESVANSNYSMISIEFNEEADIDNSVIDILQDINMVSGSWDEMIGTSTILKLNPSMIPISVMAVEYEGKTQAELSQFLEDELLDALEGTTGVASIDTSGMISEKLKISINQEKIDEINDKVLSSINAQLAQAKNELLSQKAELDSGLTEAKAGQEELQSGLDQVNQGLIGVQAAKAVFNLTENNDMNELNQAISDFMDDNNMTGNPEDITGPINTQLATSKEEVEKQEAELLATKSYLETNKAALDETVSMMTAAQSQMNSALSSLDSQAASAREQADIGDKITVEMIANLLMAQNFDMPVGYIEEGEEKYLISVGDKVASLEETENLLLMSVDVEGVGDVTLSDVADVYIEDNEDSIYANLNGNPSVLLMLSKQSNYATAEVSGNISSKVSELEEMYPGLNLVYLMDQGEYIFIMISAILKSLLFGAIFAVIILLIFLRDYRPTLITIISIPTSMMFAIFLMYMMGVSINLISLSGLAVAVGMIVDNSVVVIENIYRLKKEGLPIAKAAYAGAKQVAAAITASTLTTVSVFVPIIFISGLTKQLFSDMAITVTVSLLASLIIGLTLVPAMSSKMLGAVEPKVKPEGTVLTKYRQSLAFTLKHKAWILIIATILLFISAYSIISKGFIFMPQMNSPQVSVNIEYPEETPFDEVKEMSDEIVEKISSVEGVTDVGTMLGGGMNFSSSGSGVQQVTVYAMIGEDSGRTTLDVEKEINGMEYPSKANVSATGSDVSDFTTAMGGEGVVVEIRGNDLTELQEGATLIAEKLKTVEGIDEVDDGLGKTEPEIHFVVDKQKAMKEGLMVASVFGAISERINDEMNSTDIDTDEKSYEIVVSQGKYSDLTIEDLKNMEITATTMTGEETSVKLKDVTEVVERNTLSQINRKNQNRIITVSGTLKEDYNITLTTSDAMKAVKDVELPEGLSIEFHGENESVMDGINKLSLMLLLGVLFIYLIMVAQFQSLKSPFIIMFTIPLAMTGGFIALMITGNNLSVVAMIGLVMLVGIIVNNGIVLVDYVNQLRAKGYDKKKALIEAGVTRMRPILMTSLTTVCGLLVMAFGGDMGTELMQPVAIVCIGGLIYATIMTLYIVPCIYDYFHKEEFKFISNEDLDISDIIV